MFTSTKRALYLARASHMATLPMPKSNASQANTRSSKEALNVCRRMNGRIRACTLSGLWYDHESSLVKGSIHMERRKELTVRLSISGSLPTWSSRPLPSAHWRSQSSIWASLILFSSSSSSTSLASSQSVSFQLSAHGSDYARWSSHDISTGIMVSSSVRSPHFTRQLSRRLTLHSRHLQHSSLRRLVRRQRHRRRSNPERNQRRHPRLGRHHCYRSLHLLRYSLRL